MKNPLNFVLFSIFYLITLVSFAYADVVSSPIYGGGQIFISTGNILIDKKVINPKTQKFVDTLSINDPKYQPSASINFQISLTNTGNTEIKHIDVKDIFPEFVSFTAGPGSFDVNTKTLSFSVDNLKPKETRTFALVGKIVEANRLPIDQGIVCIVNQTTATTTDSGMSQDSASFCIQKQVLAAKISKGGFPVFPAPTIATSPATGGELFPIISLIPTGIIGWYLRKHALKKIKDPIR